MIYFNEFKYKILNYFISPGINSVTNSEGLNGGPYLTVSYSNSEFTIAPNAQFESYEENETELSIGVTVNFRCTGGSSNTLVSY